MVALAAAVPYLGQIVAAPASAAPAHAQVATAVARNVTMTLPRVALKF